MCYVVRCCPYLYFVLQVSPWFYFEIPFGLDSLVKISALFSFMRDTAVARDI